MRTLVAGVGMLLWLGLAGWPAPAPDDPVVVQRVPEGGIAPQAVTDANGVVHIVFYKGDPSTGDIYYTRRSADGTFSPARRVNSRPASAIAIGSVRGAQMSVGPTGHIHVVWNGSDAVVTPPAHGRALLYARSTDGGATFSAERDLVTWGTGLDGGGSVAAGADGRVYAVWHATPAGKTDADGAVYLSRSNDDGVTFARENRIDPSRNGACGCCSIRALVDRRGSLFVVYRAAGADVHRDITLLRSDDRGATFTARRLDPWDIAACPLSSMSLAEGARGVTAAWETMGRVRVADVTAGPGAPWEPVGESRPDRRKHPVITYNRAGDMLVAWLDGTAWARGGSVAWQMYDAGGHATPARGLAPGVPVWGLAAVAALPDGRFLVLY